MEIIADLDFMNLQLKRSVAEVLNELKEDEGYSSVSEEDVFLLERWVGGFSCEEDDDDDENEMEGDRLMRSFIDSYSDHEASVSVPFRRESFVGRNDSCPCGSGKKYKKCCLPKHNK